MKDKVQNKKLTAHPDPIRITGLFYLQRWWKNFVRGFTKQQLPRSCFLHHPGKANQCFPVEVEYEETEFFAHVFRKFDIPGLFSDLQMIIFFIVELPKDNSTKDQP